MGNWNEQRFLAPGTWTWPGNVTHAEVILVGGGGGGSPDSAGGGGGYRREYTPVTSPVPVTVGAGGTPSPPAPATNGGTSSFGPIQVGGGGGGAPLSPSSAGTPAPPIGGGGGQAGNASRTGGWGGQYGHRSVAGSAGGAGSCITGFQQPWIFTSGRGIAGFGGGGSIRARIATTDGGGRNDPIYPALYQAAVSNTGGGAEAFSPGGSGIVIVRWFE